MQETNVNDLQYQPNVKDTYSFKKPFLKLELFISRFTKGILLIILLIPVLISGVIGLNYFNIIPLSQNYPNYFFDLPHKESSSQSIDAIKLLSDGRVYSKNSNSWSINAKFFRKNANILYFYYKDTLISLKINTNTNCGIIDRDTIANDNSSAIEDIACDSLFTPENYEKTFNIEYEIGKNNDFTILSTQLD